MHFWSSTTGKRLGAPKILDIAKAHTQITTVAFSHRFRLYILFTADFKIFFLNELLKLLLTMKVSVSYPGLTSIVICLVFCSCFCSFRLWILK